jgi:transcriptional regulator with XRE-family HTH domain
MRIRTVRELGLLVRGERRRRELSLQALAAQVGCSRQWLAGFELGSARAEITLVLRTLNVLGIRLDAEPAAREGAEP